jgi:4-hydroxy-3-methylbut-2-enyl diphosphate reductase
MTTEPELTTLEETASKPAEEPESSSDKSEAPVQDADSSLPADAQVGAEAAEAPETAAATDEPAAELQPDPAASPVAEAPAVEAEALEPAPEPVSEAPEAESAAAPEATAEPEAPAEPEAIAQAEPSKPEAPAPQEPKISDAQLFEQAMSALEGGDEDAGVEGGFKKLSKGDRVEATVIQVDKDRVFVDLGTKSEGVVPIGELTDLNIEHASEHVKVGDKIQVVVLRPEGAEGNAVVSKKRADFEEAWDRIEQSFNEGKSINALVVDRVKGGLVVDIGVRGFVPATHVGSGKLRNIEKFVGQNLPLKIIEIDRERKKVVLSNRQAEEERRSSAKEHIFENVSPGDILEGTVRRLVDYGAFIDLGGVDGLLHISEMSWMRIAHPKEMFREGQKIKVMVLRLDPAAGKISLGHRQVLPDPWNLIRDNYTIGQKLTCTIGRIVQTGAFVKLNEGAEAFLPLSEMSMRRIRRPEEAVSEGQEVEVQIIDLRPDDRRMVLSMRAAGSADRGGPSQMTAPSYDEDRDLRRGVGGGLGKKKKLKGGGGGGRGRGGREEEEFEDVAVGRRGFATGGATIGERLGMLKGFTLRDEDADEDIEEPAEEAVEETAEAAAPAEAPAEAPAQAEQPEEAQAEAPAEEKSEEPSEESAEATT